MKTEQKGILINAIIGTLNEQLKKQNKELCQQNLYSEQKPLHGGDMFFRLANLEDSEIKELATACNL